jgi:alanine racemase
VHALAARGCGEASAAQVYSTRPLDSSPGNNPRYARWQNQLIMPRPIEAIVHTEALAHNLRRARRAAPQSRVWAVVKANAYGHGIERAYAGLCGADGFALLDLDEAQRVRSLGWRGPILLLEGCFEPRDLELCSRLDLWHTVHHEAQIDMLAAR